MEDGAYKTVTRDEPGDNILREVFVDGRLCIDNTLANIRDRASV